MPSFKEKIEGLFSAETTKYKPPGYSGVGEMAGDAYSTFVKWSSPEEVNKRLARQFPPIDISNLEKLNEKAAELTLGFMPFGAGVKGVGAKTLVNRMLKSKNPVDRDLLSGLRTGRFTAKELQDAYRGLRAQGTTGNTIGEMRESLPQWARTQIETYAKRGKELPPGAIRELPGAWDLTTTGEHQVVDEILSGTSQAKAALTYLSPETFFNRLASSYGKKGGPHASEILGWDRNLIKNYAQNMKEGAKFPIPVLWRKQGSLLYGMLYGHQGRHRTLAAAKIHQAEKIPVLVVHSEMAKRPAQAFRRFGKHEPAPPRKEGWLEAIAKGDELSANPDFGPSWNRIAELRDLLKKQYGKEVASSSGLGLPKQIVPWPKAAANIDLYKPSSSSGFPIPSKLSGDPFAGVAGLGPPGSSEKAWLESKHTHRLREELIDYVSASRLKEIAGDLFGAKSASTLKRMMEREQLIKLFQSKK